jgi:hypothetical protein
VPAELGTYVFPGQDEDNAFGSFPNHWEHLFEDSPLEALEKRESGALARMAT